MKTLTSVNVNTLHDDTFAPPPEAERLFIEIAQVVADNDLAHVTEETDPRVRHIDHVLELMYRIHLTQPWKGNLEAYNEWSAAEMVAFMLSDPLRFFSNDELKDQVVKVKNPGGYDLLVVRAQENAMLIREYRDCVAAKEYSKATKLLSKLRQRRIVHVEKQKATG